MEKIDPLLRWVESEFGFKPVLYTSFFGGKQEDGLVMAIENLLKKTDDCELAAIDAIAASAHSLTLAIGMVQGKLQIEEYVGAKGNTLVDHKKRKNIKRVSRI